MNSSLEPRYGLELAEALGIPSGTLYPILHRLVDAGWLESMWEDVDPRVEERPRRRFYRLTGEARLGAPVRIREALGPQIAVPQGVPAPAAGQTQMRLTGLALIVIVGTILIGLRAAVKEFGTRAGEDAWQAVSATGYMAAGRGLIRLCVRLLFQPGYATTCSKNSLPTYTTWTSSAAGVESGCLQPASVSVQGWSAPRRNDAEGGTPKAGDGRDSAASSQPPQDCCFP